MSLSGKITIGFLLWLQALFLGSTFQTWLPVIAATLMATTLVAVNRRNTSATNSGDSTGTGRLTPTLKWLLVIASALAVFVITLVWRLESQLSIDVNVLSVSVDAVAHWALFCSLIAWSLRPNRGHVAMLGLGMVVLLLGVASGGTSRSMAAQTSISLAACVGFTLAAQVILGTARGTGGAVFADAESDDEGSLWMARTIPLISLSLILMATGVVANATSRVLPGLQRVVQEQLQESLDVVTDRTGIGGTRYVRSGELGSIRQHIAANPTEISLVVKSKYMPGYLRGRVYDLYRKRRWHSASKLKSPWRASERVTERRLAPVSDGKIKLDFRVPRNLKRFHYPQEPEDAALPPTSTHVTVYNNPVKGYVVFTPLATHWIEANSGGIIIGDHDQIGMGVNVTNPYVAGVGQRARRDILTPEQRQVLTTVPAAMVNEARRVAKDVCADSLTARNKAAAVSRYFQSQANYTLRTEAAPAEVDPIANFLEKKHPAHCEYFASATAMVLRAAGVPTRYVTGYVVDEPNERDPELWLARNRDAHAWVEAYDDVGEYWFAVESTPGRTYNSAAMLDSSLANRTDSQLAGEEDDVGSGNVFARAWGWLLSLRATDALVVVYQFAQLPLFLFLVIFWWVKFRRTAADSRDEVDSQSMKMLRRFDRNVRKHALTRLPNETLYQFADRIESNTREPMRQNAEAQLRRFAAWYRQYANARYRGQLPQPLAESLN